MNSNYIYEDNLCLIKTKKYKNISFYLNFVCEHDVKTKLIINLLARFIGEYSKKYPSKESMTKAKDMLYGATFTTSSKVKTNLLFLTIKYSFINPKFLKDVTINDYIDFFKECFNNVNFTNELLDEFKKNYKDSLLRTLDKPSSLASNRAVQILAQENKNFEVYDIDHLNQIDEISLDEVIDTYNKLLTEFSIHPFVVGDYDESMYEFAKSYKNNIHHKLINESLIIKDLGEVIEEKEVSQSCLIVMYDSPNNRLNPDYYAYFLGDALLGMIPTSFLFNDVREKLSLCYYIGVSEYKNEGIVKVITLFDYKNKDTVVDKIKEEMKRLVEKDYSEEELTTAKAIMKDNLNSTLDNNDSLVEYLLVDHLNGLNMSLEEYATNIDKVTRDDISRVYKNYTHILTYMLKGVKNEEDL